MSPESLSTPPSQQLSFFEAQPISKLQKEAQDWITAHNNQYGTATQNFKSWGNTSFSSALNSADARQNAVYLLRGFLAQQMKKVMTSKDETSKKIFIKILRNEIKMKKTNLDPAVLVRNSLMLLNRSR